MGYNTQLVRLILTGETVLLISQSTPTDVSMSRRRALVLWVVWLLPIGFALYMDLRHFFSIYGLPIDDAYIYVKYIENLHHNNGYSFNPGETSFGVTSFLFTVLCAAIYDIVPFLGSLRVCQGIGMLSHVLLLGLFQRILYSETKSLLLSFLGGMMLAACRPIYFTAPSGLETSLFNFMILLAVWAARRKPSLHPVWIGFIAGLLFLTRPEGLYFTLTYFFCCLLYPFFFCREKIVSTLRRIGAHLGFYAAGFSLISLPYLIFVQIHTGHWLPTTFYGKMLNRNLFYQRPWYNRIGNGFRCLMLGFQQIFEMDPFFFVLGTLLFLTLISLLGFALMCHSRRPALPHFAARGALYCYLFFPFIYGAFFFVNPLFGGYAARYIQFVIILIHLEGFLALHQLIEFLILPTWKPRVGWTVRNGVLLLLLPCALFAAWHSHNRLQMSDVDLDNLAVMDDLNVYKRHVTVNESVRRKAAEWINQNTEPDARILSSNTGLGALGAYCNRYILDEAGLINPSVYPYLLGFHRGQSHWQKMLEYMKAEGIDFVTTFPPYGDPTRHIEKAATVEEPSLKGSPLERLIRIQISRFVAPERYDLTADFPNFAVVVDRSIPAKPEGRAQAASWNQEPAIAVIASTELLDVRYQLIFPTHPRFKVSLALNPAGLTASSPAQVTCEIKVNYEGIITPQYVQTFSLDAGSSPRVEPIEIDLEAYSQKFGYLLFGVKCDLPSGQALPVYWVRPELFSTTTEPNQTDK